ncbi:hypothetical protein [Candidatus Magnetaquicoccus inordinatus]|uniref:hypothetical protein n=1 Tax=Candidatus Magnetaquicoccus inordinatus TaxID=2496818 RepID=UPI00187D2AA2|nr:hypothetical protein [Candidatus Magnetaquicoccus inordinatus]
MFDASTDSSQEPATGGLIGLFNKLAGAIIALFIKADPFLTTAPSANSSAAVPFETE